MEFFEDLTNLSILSAMITPAVLILASSQLIVATSQRLGRVIDRTRQLNEELILGNKEMGPGFRRHLTHVLGLTLRRSILLQRSMVGLYLAMFHFIGVSFSIGVIDAGNFKYEWLPVLMGIMGVALLLISSLILIFEARLSLISTTHEIGFIRSLNRDLKRRKKLLKTPPVKVESHDLTH